MDKTKKIIYWVATVWLALGMFSTGMVQLLKLEAKGQVGPPGVYGIKYLGYPIYFLTIIGIWKMLGVIALFLPKFPLLKEWAYAGFFFLTTGAIFSHVAMGDPFKEIFPSVLLLILTILSWYFRPASKKFNVAVQ
ncbi:MAG: DoxX family protein [Bacteroidetes bacterium]|nr:DoxX family protein [Bacteroidota bacterium]